MVIKYRWGEENRYGIFLCCFIFGLKKKINNRSIQSLIIIIEANRHYSS